MPPNVMMQPRIVIMPIARVTQVMNDRCRDKCCELRQAARRGDHARHRYQEDQGTEAPARLTIDPAVKKR
jgi:hypothetical protein